MSSTGKMNDNVYNRRSRSIAQGVAPPSGTAVNAGGANVIDLKKGSDNQIVVLSFIATTEDRRQDMNRNGQVPSHAMTKKKNSI